MFCKLAKQLVEDQKNELDKAVISIGEHRFCEEFKHLEVSMCKSSMTKVQQTKHLQSIAGLTMHEAYLLATLSSSSNTF